MGDVLKSGEIRYLFEENMENMEMKYATGNKIKMLLYLWKDNKEVVCFLLFIITLTEY